MEKRKGKPENKESAAQDLKYNEEKDSFEIDVEGSVKNYEHPSPYETAAEDGEDMDSDWDEANPYVGDEYEEESLTSAIEDQEMHIDEGRVVELDPEEEELTNVPEHERRDLDEEGYPKNDGEEMP